MYTNRDARPGKPERRVQGASHALGIVGGASLLTVLFFTPVVLPPAYVQNYYLALLLTGLTLLPLAVRIATRTLDIFEPIIPISLLIGLAFGVRAMYLAYDPASILPLAVGLLRFDDFMGRALAVAIAAYCALLAGYYLIGGLALPVRPSATRGGRAWPQKLNAPKLATLLGLGALATAVIRATGPGEVTRTTNLLAIVASFTQISGCILALYIATGDPRRWLRLALGGAVLPLAAWQSVALGAKAPMLLLLYAIIAARHYVRRSIGMPLIAAGVLVTVLLVFPAVFVYRIDSDSPLSVSSSRATVQEMAARAASVARQLTERTPAEYLRLSIESIITRFSGIDALSLLLKYDVSAELADPAAYLYIPLAAFVPRAIWPDKPVLERGTEFGRLLIDPTFQGITWRSSFGMFHLGDLYVTFGVAGLLIGMCALGCLYRLVYRLLDPRRTTDLGTKFVYILLLWMIVSGFESDIPAVYANILKSVAIWAVIKTWLNAPAAASAPASSRPAGQRLWAFQPGVVRAGAARQGGMR